MGNHSITFVDTTKAWQQLLESMRSKAKEGSIFNSSHLFTDIDLSTDDKLANVQEIVLPEYALYTEKYFAPRKEWTCTICKKIIEPHEMKSKVDCRVCRNVFHLGCVKRHGLCNESICMRLDTSVGWSCHDCNNVFGLLLNEEQEEISNLYNKIAGKFYSFKSFRANEPISVPVS